MKERFVVSALAPCGDMHHQGAKALTTNILGCGLDIEQRVLGGQVPGHHVLGGLLHVQR